MRTLCLLFSLLFIGSCVSVNVTPEKNSQNKITEKEMENQSNNFDLSMYPLPKDGFKRYYFALPTVADDNLQRVALTVGKNMLVDCNVHHISSELKLETVQGWGYDYLVFPKDYQTRSTKKNCLDASQANTFVGSATKIIRYNSKLPIVVYVPNDLDVKLVIFSATDVSIPSREF